MNSIQELKERYLSYISSDTVIAAILFKLNNTKLPKDPGVIHEVIYKLKMNKKYKDLLEDFYFDDSGLTPFSKELDEILFRMELSGILKTLNPHYECYNISGNKDLLESHFKKFGQREQDIICEMSEEFEKNMRCDCVTTQYRS